MKENIRTYLREYLDTLPVTQEYGSICSGYFCANEEDANMCSELILKGIKTATCSMQYWYDIGEEPLPKVGDLHVVTNWQGDPTSIIEISKVQNCKYKDVNQAFAAAEGEGDGSLDYWRKVHWDFFLEECRDANTQPSEEMMLVLESFHLVYR